MTGLVEMASIPQWKQNIVGSGRGYDDLNELGGKVNDGYDKMNISDIPSWKRNHIVSNSNTWSPAGRRSSGPSDSSGSSSLINNIPRCNEENGNNVRFEIGGNECDTQEVTEMGFDRSQGFVDTSLSNILSSTSVKGIDSSHLKHVQSNPFFRELGGITHPHGRVLNDSLPESPQLSRSGSISTTSTEEDLENYSPHSGIVEKLRKKFSSLSNKDGGSSKLRRYGSLDNLLDRGSTHPKHQPPVIKSTVQRSSVSSEQDVTTKPLIIEKGKQTVNHAVRRSVPKPPRIMDMSRSRTDSSSSADEQHSPKPRIVSGEIKDIIIIEQKPKPVKQSPKSTEQNVIVQTKNIREETEETELPKPNTVSNFRSLFEASSLKQDGRKILPDVPRSPKFISAAKPPPLPKSKPPKPLKTFHKQSLELKVTDVKKESDSEISSSSHHVTAPSANISIPSVIEATSDTAVISSVSSSSQPSTVISAVSCSSQPSTVISAVSSSSQPSIVTSVKPNESESKPSQNNNNKSETPPRAFDSPVTRKKEFGDKKSIFDSSSIEPVTNTKQPPRMKRTAPKARAPLAPVQTSASSNDSQNTVTPTEIQIQEIKPLPSKHETNVEENVVKVSDAVKNFSSGKDKSAKKKPNSGDNKILIFDSSSIVVPKLKTKGVNKDHVEKPLPVKAPPRPKAAARKLRQSESIDESEKNVPMPSTKVEDKVFELAKDPVESAVKKGNEISVTVNVPEVTPQIETSSKTHVEDEKQVHIIAQNTFNPTVTSTPTLSETTQSTPRFAPVSASEMHDVRKSIENGTESNEGDYTPKKGIPSIIANRLKPKDSSDTGNVVSRTNINEDDSDDETSHQLVLPSQFRTKGLLANGVLSSPVPKKKHNNVNKEADKPSTETLLDLTKNSAKNNEIQRTNIDDLIKGKRSSPVSVFDSSKIPAKKKPVTSTPAANGVPPLDLSLIEEKKNHPYQDGYIPTKIQPCKIVFQGAGVKLKTTPLAKTRKQKLKIQFNDTATATHEYQSESAALHDYLVIHPHEEEEAKQEEKVLKLEDFEFADQESSDDIPDTPRSNGTPESTIKSNTAISHSGSGGFVGYKSKMSMDFEFGMSMHEEETVTPTEPEVNNANPEDMDFLPADEDNTHNWTDTSIPDMLF